MRRGAAVPAEPFFRLAEVSTDDVGELLQLHDHVRIEHMLFDGAPRPDDGVIRPDLARAGLGIAFKGPDAERFAQTS